MRSLCHAYSDQTAEGAGVRYRDFAESIDKVFRIRKAEKNPQQFHPPPGASLPLRFTPRRLPEDQQAALEDVLRRLALLAKTRGIIFKYCYQTFDHLHSGFVSPDTFRRNFPFDGSEGKFTEEEIRLLAEGFTSHDGKGVNYSRIHELMTEQGADIKVPFAVSPYDPRPSNRRWSHEELQVEQKLQAITALKQLPLRDLFKDVDRLRKGCCTRTQARAAFTSFLNISLNDEEWNYLVDKYTNDEGMFVYAALCDIVERVFTREDLDKHPLVRINIPGRAELEPAQRSWISRSRREEEKIDDIEAALKKKVEQTRKAIKPLFQDFDRQRT